MAANYEKYLFKVVITIWIAFCGETSGRSFVVRCLAFSTDYTIYFSKVHEATLAKFMEFYCIVFISKKSRVIHYRAASCSKRSRSNLALQLSASFIFFTLSLLYAEQIISFELFTYCADVSEWLERLASRSVQKISLTSLRIKNCERWWSGEPIVVNIVIVMFVVFSSFVLWVRVCIFLEGDGYQHFR